MGKKGGVWVQVSSRWMKETLEVSAAAATFDE